jgi:hypothetical protein
MLRGTERRARTAAGGPTGPAGDHVFDWADLDEAKIERAMELHRRRLQVSAEVTAHSRRQRLRRLASLDDMMGPGILNALKDEPTEKLAIRVPPGTRTLAFEPTWDLLLGNDGFLVEDQTLKHMLVLVNAASNYNIWQAWAAGQDVDDGFYKMRMPVLAAQELGFSENYVGFKIVGMQLVPAICALPKVQLKPTESGEQVMNGLCIPPGKPKKGAKGCRLLQRSLYTDVATSNANSRLERFLAGQPEAAAPPTHGYDHVRDGGPLRAEFPTELSSVRITVLAVGERSVQSRKARLLSEAAASADAAPMLEPAAPLRALYGAPSPGGANWARWLAGKCATESPKQPKKDKFKDNQKGAPASECACSVRLSTHAPPPPPHTHTPGTYIHTH